MRSEALILALLLAGLSPAWAGEVEQLEPVGPTSAVIESDLVDELRQRAVSVDVEQLRHAQAGYQPANLHALPRATKDATTMVDLTHTLEQDVQDANGQVLYPAGFTFNPLRYVSLSGALVVNDYDYFIYTSKPTEIAEIERMVQGGASYHEAILEMVARRADGAL